MAQPLSRPATHNLGALCLERRPDLDGGQSVDGPGRNTDDPPRIAGVALPSAAALDRAELLCAELPAAHPGAVDPVRCTTPHRVARGTSHGRMGRTAPNGGGRG